MSPQFFDQIEECEWAIEVCAEFGLPIAATMTVGPMGDLGNVSAADCAVRMAKGLFLYDVDQSLCTSLPIKGQQINLTT